MTFHSAIRQQLHDMLSSSQDNEIAQLNNALRLISKWRSSLIQNTLLKHNGTIVMQGPFKGLDFISQSSEGCHIPKLIGCYEQPLKPFIDRLTDTPYRYVINVGCAEGYYAVGLARKLPRSLVKAYDTDSRAQKACSDLAKKNHVADRVHVSGSFSHADLKYYTEEAAVLICDIEGGELNLLTPDTAPELINMDIIVESHEVIPPFLVGWISRIYAAIFSFWAGVMPPMPMLGRSLLYVQSHCVA